MKKDAEIQAGLAIAYWASTFLAGAFFAVPGLLLLARQPHFAGDMAQLGFPAYFLPLLGIWKILGAVAILAPGLPRLKEWAYAGMMFDISAALAARTVAGNEPLKIVIPLIIAGLVAISWALRPAARKLAGPIL
jgi:uncharacterized membrane protein YphA (DoxX/SURF4 family)